MRLSLFVLPDTRILNSDLFGEGFYGSAAGEELFSFRRSHNVVGRRLEREVRELLFGFRDLPEAPCASVISRLISHQGHRNSINFVKLMTSIEVQKLHTLTGHRDAVYTVVAGEQPSQFFSGAGDGMIVLWDLKTPEEGARIAQLPNSVYALLHVPHMGVLVAGHNYNGIHVLDWK